MPRADPPISGPGPASPRGPGEDASVGAALEAARTPEALARGLVEVGVAPAAAVGFATRAGGRWEISAGGATDLLFDLASVTKSVTALALARSGVDRRTRIGTLLDEARGTASEEMPIELLLAHRAGLEAHVSLYAPLAHGETFSREAALRAAASARRQDAPGDPPDEEGFSPLYSDLGYVLAGEAVARATGAVDAGAALVKLVAEPLGREHDLGPARDLEARGVHLASRAAVTEEVPWRGGVVRGVVHDENAWALTGRGGSGHAGLFGSVEAVLAFGCATLDAIVRKDGPLRTGGDVDWLVRERPGGTLRAGFDGKSAIGSSAGELAGPRTFGHLGFTGTSLWIDPDADVVLVVLTNRVHPTRDNTLIRPARPAAHDALFRMAESRAGGFVAGPRRD